MKQIAIFILLAMSVSCNNNVKVLKFLDKVECVKTGANLSFEEINVDTINEMTVCLHFKLKFLKKIDFVNFADGLQWIKITDFVQKAGFIAFNTMAKMFVWTHQVSYLARVFKVEAPFP